MDVKDKWLHQVDIVNGNDVNVYMLLAYLIIFSAAGNLSNSGWFSQNTHSEPSIKVSWKYIYSGATIAIFLLVFSAFRLTYWINHAIYLFTEGQQYPELLALPNTGQLFFRFLSIVFITIYACLLLLDAFKMYRSLKQPTPTTV